MAELAIFLFAIKVLHVRTTKEIRLDLGSDSELSELFSSDEYQDEEVHCDKCNVCLCLRLSHHYIRDINNYHTLHVHQGKVCIVI